jgi:hypothetical protein
MSDFANTLWATAMQLAQEAGMEFTVPCSHNLHDFIGAGVHTMQRQGRLSETDQEQADANMTRLALEMIRVTRGLGTTALSGSKTAIREGAVVQAKRLGGLWPYC